MPRGIAIEQRKMSEDSKSTKTFSSDAESASRADLARLLGECPIPQDQILANLGLFLDSKNLARILCMDFLYQKVVEVQGVVMEFGTHWGQNLAIFSALRGIYDSFNRHRKIIGFDTFEGFPDIHAKDGSSELMKTGNVSVSEGYEDFLNEVLNAHEKLNPLSHIPKFELRKGDVSETLSDYLEDHPHTIVALAYFDLDLYEPTKQCLENIKPRIVKGSLLAFDELNDADSPGETIALLESIGLNNIRLQRHPRTSRISYFIYE